MSVRIEHGDSRDVLKMLAAESIDACVTDPPYGLQFMGREWDKLWRNSTEADQAYVEKTAGELTSRARKLPDYKASKPEQMQEFHLSWAREVLRVLKPGGHLVAFGGDRTYHRLVCAIEDAGFEVRNTIAWVFGSGFPKNHNVSRRLTDSLPADVLRACDRCDWQIAQGSLSGCLSYRDPDDGQSRSAEDSDLDMPPSQCDARGRSHVGRHADDRDEVQASICLDAETDRHANGGSSLSHPPQSEDCPSPDNIPSGTASSRSPAELTAGHKIPHRKSGNGHSDDGSASEPWYANLPQCQTCGKRGIPQGLGTALKPAMELICLARKPLIGTVAANVLAHGTGGLNIDGCRVEANDKGEWPITQRRHDYKTYTLQPVATDNTEGRWPANIIHDGSEEVIAAFPGAGGGYGVRGGNESLTSYGFAKGTGETVGFGDFGSAARFFKSAGWTEDDLWNSDLVNFAADCSSLQSEAIVTALSNAVVRSMPGSALQRASYRAPSTSATATELKTLCALVITLTQSIAARYLLGLPPERLTVQIGPANAVAATMQTGITTITASRWKSDGSAAPVTFNITLPSAARGASASASRFHYDSKADSDDRLGSRHPTVKPVSLMSWLVKLVCPSGGTILDPFAGSGTTGMACMREGFDCILIEREAEYVKDIRARLAHVHGLDTPLFAEAGQ